jgi:hypothetical protein
VDAPSLYAAVALQAKARAHVQRAGPAVQHRVWAFAEARVEAPSLFEAIEREAVVRTHTFDALALSSTACAFATAGVSAPRLFAATHRAARGGARGASLTREASRARHVRLRPLARARRVCLPPWRSGRRRSWARSTRKTSPTQRGRLHPSLPLSAPRLFEAIVPRVEALMGAGEFNTQNRSNIAWAFATAAVCAPRLFAAVARQAVMARGRVY